MGTLAGQRVSIAGRLLSMTRSEAVSLIEREDGVYAAHPDRRTTILVVGEGDGPLGEDGQLTHQLEKARQLQRAGGALRVQPESEFFSAIGATRPESERQYTTWQLSRILDVPAPNIVSWIRKGLIEPARTENRLAYFEFGQVAGAKALNDLLAKGVPPKAIRKSLRELERWMPEAQRSLAQLAILERGGLLLVRLEDGTLAEPSGQLHFDLTGAFDDDPAPATPPKTIAPSLRARLRSVPAPMAGVDPTRRAQDLEEAGLLDEAARVYEEALAAHPDDPEVPFNLGNVLYRLDRKADAAQRFLETLERDPDYVEAWNNLGSALFELERTEDAVRAFRRGLEIDPHYADAHYNLAEALDALGERREACDHWRAYLAQDPSSRWADHVRERLTSTWRNAHR